MGADRKLAASFLLAVVGLSSVVSGQSAMRVETKARYKVVSVRNVNVTTTDKCLGLKLVMAVVPKRTSRENIEYSGKRIVSSYLKEYDVVVFFVSSRKAARMLFGDHSDEDESWMNASLRGIYSRRVGSTESIRFFPSGPTERDLEDLEPQEGQ